MRSVWRRLSYANVVATLALFVALGGGAYATIALPRNSVGTAQLKNSAVNSAKVRNGSLRASDFRSSDLAQLRGPAGALGAAGAPGAPGAGGSSIVARYTLDNVPLGITTAGAAVSLSGPAWTQKAGTIDFVVGNATVKGPTAAGCSSAGHGPILWGYLTTDPGGVYVGSFSVGAGQGVTYPTNIPSEALTQTPPQEGFGNPMPMLYEPSTDSSRQLKLYLVDRCGTPDDQSTQHMEVDSLKLSVIQVG
jgi:hypothetical protein